MDSIEDSIFKHFQGNIIYACLQHSTIVHKLFRPLLAEKLDSEEVNELIVKLSKSVTNAIYN